MFSSISSILILIFLSSVAQAVVPPSKTFKYVNQGEFGEYLVEYRANYRVLSIISFPFTLCFYNTTPNAYTLGLRMGNRHSESIMRWFWDANRGNPVRENATLTFGADGNLVLADADGRIAWQTGTAHKGVVGLKLLPNGNMVLFDKQGRFLWQSFNHPTDTLLVGQSLNRNGHSRLVSRVSDVDGSEGPYSFALGRNQLATYFKSKNSPKPMPYYNTEDRFGAQKSPIQRAVLGSFPVSDEGFDYNLIYELYEANSNASIGQFILTRTKYNSTLSMLRVESDGNLKIYTYDARVDFDAWENPFTLFDKNGWESECQLPKKCGSLGVCEDNQCVACPTPQGLLGWSKTCEPPKLPPCKGGEANVDYYKVVGVEHYLNRYTKGDGPMKVAQCREKCSKDCGCLGFFYREETSKCFLAPELGTLAKVSNQSHVGYIKISK